MKISRQLLSFAFAIVFTPVVALPTFLVGYFLVSAWSGDFENGSAWADYFWREWGRLLRAIRKG